MYTEKKLNSLQFQIGFIAVFILIILFNCTTGLSQQMNLLDLSPMKQHSISKTYFLKIVDTFPGTFIDISAIAKPFKDFHGESEKVVTTTIGNKVFPAGTIVIANNGGISFGWETADPARIDLPSENEELPSQQAFCGHQALFGFWDDIGNTVIPSMFFETQDMIIVQWHRHFENSENTLKFQIHILKNPIKIDEGFIVAQMIYQDIEQPRAGGGISATIGYQDGGVGFNDVQWSYNLYDAVKNDMVLSIVLID